MRIILADDHSLVRDSLRQYISMLSDQVDIQEAGDLNEVMALLDQNFKPDMILLDLQMPGMKGVDSISDVRKAFGKPLIVIISANADSAVIAGALRNGANGYIPKTMSGKSLVTALRLVLDGETYVPPALLNVSSMAAAAPVSAAPMAEIPGGLSRLSHRESAVLRLLISGKSNKEIALKLDLQEVTVKVHLRNVYRKINATNRADAVRIILSQKGVDEWLARGEQPDSSGA
ncbi:MAG: response regulator transcription factor [Rhodospirillaceae bacterium]|nr:response regulator transcription factor [Rhodospirillaceae bacterium]